MSGLADNAALVLGLAISLFTIYSAIESWLTRRRGRRALLASLRAELGQLKQLMAIVATKADSLADRLRDHELSQAEAQLDLAALRARVDHLIERGHRWDVERLGPLLTAGQLAAFLRLADGLDLYRTRLTLRTAEYDAAPDRDGALARFLASAGLVDDAELHDRLAAFEGSLSQAWTRWTRRPK